MDATGGEKRKADEMASDSVEVPLADLREVAEKAGEKAEAASAWAMFRNPLGFAPSSGYCHTRTSTGLLD